MGGGGSWIPFPHTHRFLVCEWFSGGIGGWGLVLKILIKTHSNQASPCLYATSRYICICIYMYMGCSVLQCGAACCSVLQCVAVCCCIKTWLNRIELVLCPNKKSNHTTVSVEASSYCASEIKCLGHPAKHCNALLHAATHCNTLQRTTTHCNTLQQVYPSWDL